MKTRILLTMLLCCFFIAAYGQTCGYCNGTGKMIVNKGIATYGNDELVWCKECQKHFHRSTGHMHIHCKYCKGTGIRQSSSSSSGSSSGYTSTDEIAAINPQAYGMAMNALYGLPTTDEEINCIKNLLAESEANGKRYIRYRNLLNEIMIYLNRNMKMGNTQGTTVKGLDAYINNYYNRLVEVGNDMYLPPRATEILTEHVNRVDAAYKSYRSAVSFQQNLNNLNDQLFMQELIRNSIY